MKGFELVECCDQIWPSEDYIINIAHCGRAGRALMSLEFKSNETRIRVVALEMGKRKEIGQRSPGKLRKYLSIGNGKDKVAVWHLGN